MNAKQVTLIVTFQARPGKEAELRKTLLGLIPPTLKEDGCINYDLHVAPEDPAKFLFYENWTRKAHLDAHLQNTHIQVLLPRLDELAVGKPEIKFWENIA